MQLGGANGHFDVIESLVKYLKVETEKESSEKDNNIDPKTLLRKRINKVDCQGCSALYYATLNRHAEYMMLLIDNG
jgi:hypothetical protein